MQPLSRYFTSEYLLNPIPPRGSGLLATFLIFFILLVFVGALFHLMKNKARSKELLGRLSKSFFVSGILGLIYAFGRFEQLPWLGSRIYLLAVLVIFLFWILRNLYWMIRYVPKQIREREIEERYQKYLPKAKRK